MKRRSLLASTTAVCISGVAGCLDGFGYFSRDNEWDPSSVECRRTARLPDPPEPESDVAVSPFEYPDPPDPTSEEERHEYVETFEEAYVGNEQVRVRGESLAGFGLGGPVETTDSGPNWAVVRLEYDYFDEIEYDDGSRAEGTSGVFVAKYAITPDWIRRTVTEGDGDPADPREAGRFVHCAGA
ncbi:hypothetical protein [Halovivax gelatinilyticus]|uniref:hypothetical protein n=1 Tax=Halovivax gelatinilyticus TaxID=2961597 RepID=UPI0020CA50FC|nr:hypothetical protein [Halovivax gelatinilyticus]